MTGGLIDREGWTFRPEYTLLMFYIRSTVHAPVINTVLAPAPLDRFIIQVRKFFEYTSLQEVLLHKANETFYRTLGKRVTWLAEPGMEAYVPHEEFLVMLPDRFSLRISPDHNTLHVICQDVLRNIHE